MSDTLAFMKPGWWSSFATVSSSGVDSDYLAAWLCDIRPNRPVRWTSGAMSATIANPAGDADVVVIGHHNLQAGLTITISGDVSASTVVPALLGDDIPWNPFALVGGSPAGVNSITVSVSGNSEDVIIGEIAIGELHTIGLPLLPSVDFDFGPTKNIMPAADVSSLLPYDKDAAQPRIFSGTYLLSNAQMLLVRDWYLSQRGQSKPSVIIPDVDVNDAWFVTFEKCKIKPVVSQATANASERLWVADLSFKEFERQRW